MLKKLRAASLLLGVLGLLVPLAFAGSAGAANGGRPFRVTLSGANEVPPNPHGNLDRGSAVLRINPGQERICSTFTSYVVQPGESLPHHAHLHRAPAGQIGAPLVTLFGPPAGPEPTSFPTEELCVSASRELIRDIMRNPQNYYVNLHNEPHHTGVMRGQLA